MKVPEGFLSEESRMMFNNFDTITKGSEVGLRKALIKEHTFLQGNQSYAKEEVGDYLGPKIPSLLEFMENKIYLRSKLGISHIKRKAGPMILPHFKPPGLI